MMRHIVSNYKCFNLIKQCPGLNSSAPRVPKTRNDSVTPNLTFSPTRRNVHSSSQTLAKLFLNIENEYAFKALPELAEVKPSWAPTTPTTLEDFDRLLDQNWRRSSASAIVEAFERAKDVCVSHNIPLSDPRFDKLVDGLMDHCDKLTDDELLKLLLLLVEYPPCDNFNSHNFHDVWSCLDDICCWKMDVWSFPKMYTYANAWYKLHLGRLSDFVHEVVDKAGVKPHRLSKNMLLYTFFYINVGRKHPVAFEFEHALALRIREFNPDELAVIALGYFKTKSKVKLKPILSAMIHAIVENCGTINEISLTAMLKAIRLSQHLETVDELNFMLDRLVEQIPRLSTLSCVHLALVGTGLQLKHESSLKKCTEKVSNDLKNIRVKDIERMLLACSMFDVDSSPSFYEGAFEEIHKDTRRKEFVRYTRALPSALNYLSLRKIYSYELTNQVLGEEHIHEIYGKPSKCLPRELFSLDCCIDIECPDYEGNRLTPLKRYKAVKWLVEYTPCHNQWKRLSMADKFYLSVVDHVTAVVGDQSLIRSDHVLPHFSKSDIILCREKASGKFVAPFGFENYILGDVKRPLDLDKYLWYAVVVLSPNQTIRNASLPLGSMIMKKRQLKAVGYVPIFVFWNEFMEYSSEEKTKLLRGQLEEVVALNTSRVVSSP